MFQDSPLFQYSIFSIFSMCSIKSSMDFPIFSQNVFQFFRCFPSSPNISWRNACKCCKWAQKVRKSIINSASIPNSFPNFPRFSPVFSDLGPQGPAELRRRSCSEPCRFWKFSGDLEDLAGTLATIGLMISMILMALMLLMVWCWWYWYWSFWIIEK